MAAGRHLAAVMITDIVGFASLTQRSEAGALRLLEEHRGIVRSALRDYQGREVKTLGDGFLVEFGSALAATECGIEILRRLDDRNRGAHDERIDLRIGIHLGEVVPEGTDILGDAVNIASRIEPLAEPGGLLISGPVFDQVRGRIAPAITALPTPTLKHIFVPIAVYRVELPWKTPPLPAVTPWTDRETEYGELLQAHDRARQGRGSAVVLLGEPGTGKSRMLEEFVAGTRETGVQLLRAQALRSEASVPYALWSEAVRSYVRRASPTVLARACGPHLAEVARLVPEIVEHVGGPTSLPPPEPELAEERLMGGIVAFLTNLAQEAPLVVVLDDVQWADAYSLRLLRRAVKAVEGHRWLLLAAARDHDPSESPGVRPLLEDCRRERSCAVVALGRFAAAPFDRFLDALVPGPGLAPELRRRIHERCDGNPWFAEELLRRQVEGGAVRPTPDGWTLDPSQELRIPETVQQLLRERLDGLAPATVQVLRAASVAGSRIAYSLLREVSGVPDDLLLISVERAVQARLLVERPASAGEIELAFRDTLSRDVLYAGLSLVRARTYHRKLAEGLERLPERERRDRAAELAEHFLRGGVPEKALDYSLVAAGRAVELHAHPEAEHLYRTAVELMDELPTVETRRAETLRALAKELELLGRTTAAVDRYAEAAALWERSGELRRASSVHSWMAMLLNDLPGREGEVVGHAEKAVALLQSEGESAELAQAVYSLGAETLRWRADVAKARELFRRSVNLAERFGDRRTEAFGTYFLAVVLPIGRKDEAIDLANRLTAKLEAADDATLPTVLFNVGVNLFLTGKGDVPAARRCLETARDVSRRKGIRRHDTAVALGLAEADRLTGAWGAAEAVARGVVSRGTDEDLLERVEATILLVRLATARGRLDEAGRLLADLAAPRYAALLASPEATLLMAVLRAELENERGQPGSAWSALAPALDEGRVNPPTFSNAVVWSNALQLAVQVAASRDDARSASAWSELLGAVAEEVAEPWASGWAFRAEGLVARTRRDPAGAAEAFARSGVEWERVGWPFETARTLLLAGEAQRALGREDEASALLDRAGSLFAELGADRYANRALVALRSR